MRAALALTACLWTGGAYAQAPPTDVSGLTVHAMTDPPKVASTFPAAGQALSPGVLILIVSFDQRMLKTGFNVGAAAGAEAPQCLKTPRLLSDDKRFVLLCTTAPGKSYTVSFNAGPAGGFVNVAEKRAAPFSLAFTTTTDTNGPRSIEAAMKVEKLDAGDTPIEDSPSFADVPTATP